MWNAMRGKPIRADQAKRIRSGVQRMTGIPYDGPFAILGEQQAQRNKDEHSL
jgi:hypothetical protein